MGKPFDERVGFVDSKSKKLTRLRCKEYRTIKGGKGCIKRQAQELQKDPETTTNHHKKNRPRCHSTEVRCWPIRNFEKKFAKYLPPGGSISLSRDLRLINVYSEIGIDENPYLEKSCELISIIS